MRINQILYSSIKKSVQENFISVKKKKKKKKDIKFPISSSDFYCCQNKNFNVNTSKKENMQEYFPGWIKRKSICILISVLAQNKKKLMENGLSKNSENHHRVHF